jgi:hypothetical protein
MENVEICGHAGEESDVDHDVYQTVFLTVVDG